MIQTSFPLRNNRDSPPFSTVRFPVAHVPPLSPCPWVFRAGFQLPVCVCACACMHVCVHNQTQPLPLLPVGPFRSRVGPTPSLPPWVCLVEDSGCSSSRASLTGACGWHPMRSRGRSDALCSPGSGQSRNSMMLRGLGVCKSISRTRPHTLAQRPLPAPIHPSQFKNGCSSLAGVAQWVGRHRAERQFAGSIPGQGTGLAPGRGTCRQRQPMAVCLSHPCFFPALSPPLEK